MSEDTLFPVSCVLCDWDFIADTAEEALAVLQRHYARKHLSHEQKQKQANLMAAVKNILLNMTARDDLRDEDTGLPIREFALIMTAYAEAGGNLRQDSDTEDWPQWTVDLLNDCKAALKGEERDE